MKKNTFYSVIVCIVISLFMFNFSPMEKEIKCENAIATHIYKICDLDKYDLSGCNQIPNSYPVETDYNPNGGNFCGTTIDIHIYTSVFTYDPYGNDSYDFSSTGHPPMWIKYQNGYDLNGLPEYGSIGPINEFELLPDGQPLGVYVFKSKDPISLNLDIDMFDCNTSMESAPYFFELNKANGDDYPILDAIWDCNVFKDNNCIKPDPEPDYKEEICTCYCPNNKPANENQSVIDEQSFLEEVYKTKINKELVENIQVFPNPFNEELKIRFPKATKFEGNIEVLDVSGKVILSNSLKQSEDKYLLDTETLPAGIYFCRIDINGLTQMHKVVKTN